MTEEQRRFLITEKRLSANDKAYIEAWDWRDKQSQLTLKRIKESLPKEAVSESPGGDSASTTPTPRLRTASSTATQTPETSGTDTPSIPELRSVKDTPPFPTDAAFQHGFDYYWKAYGDKNEVCPAYNFAAALAQISQGLGRHYYISGRVGRHYPNWYQALIGASFIAAKSKVGEDTSDAISDIYEVDEDNCNIYRQTTVFDSPQGLTDFLATHDEKGVAYEWFDGINGVRGFGYIDELRGLFLKAKQTATEGLIPEITRHYKCPRTSNSLTRGNKTKAVNSVLNILGCTTIDWFENSVSISDIAGGFINRFVFYLHEQQPLYPIMKDIDRDAEHAWQNICKGCGRKSLEADRVFDLDNDCLETYKQWYIETKTKIIDDPTDIKTIAGARVIEHTLKLALVYAVLQNSEQDNLIHPSAWEPAVTVAKYWAEVTICMFENLAVDKTDKLERTILQTLQKLNGETSWSNLRKHLGSRANTIDFNRAIEAMVTAEMIAVSDGRPRMIRSIN